MFFFVALAHITTSPAPRWQTGSLGIPTPRVSLPGTSDAVHSVPCEGPNASRTETGHACETFACGNTLTEGVGRASQQK